MFLPLVIILDKVEGFKIEDKVGKKLKKEIFQSGKTKKDWLTSQVDGLDNLRKVRNEPDERWVAIPASELDDLHSNYPTHYNFIYDRILEHCLQQNLEVTFDNLLLDCLYFFNYNNMEYFRNKDGKLEKSRATLIGMAPQENKLGQIVQGFNYANPNYTNAVQNNKDLQRAKSYYGVGGVLTDKKTQFDNQQKKVQAILDARVAVASLPDSMRKPARYQFSWRDQKRI